MDMDSTYLAAVERGDMAVASAMVRAAANKAGFRIGPVYHGTNHDFTEFVKGENRMAMRAELGFWFSDDAEETKRFGEKTMPVFLSVHKPKRTTERQLDFDAVSRPATLIKAELADNGFDAYRIAAVEDNPTLDQRSQAAQWVVFSAEQIRSAEPVCRDDEGNIIPLSRRFLPGSDIRGAVTHSLGGRSTVKATGEKPEISGSFALTSPQLEGKALRVS